MTFVSPKGKNCVYYVYALVDPRDDQPFYIGKGKDRRYAAHVASWRKGNGYNQRKLDRIGAIVMAGLEVKITFLAENLTETAAYKLEDERIEALKGTLTNCAPGSVSEVEKAWDHVNYLIGRLKAPREWARSFARQRGCLPTRRDFELYVFVARNLIQNRRLLWQTMHQNG